MVLWTKCQRLSVQWYNSEKLSKRLTLRKAPPLLSRVCFPGCSSWRSEKDPMALVKIGKEQLLWHRPRASKKKNHTPDKYSARTFTSLGGKKLFILQPPQAFLSQLRGTIIVNTVQNFEEWIGNTKAMEENKGRGEKKTLNKNLWRSQFGYMGPLKGWDLIGRLFPSPTLCHHANRALV